ncbi:MAG TPA: pyruvate kinase [Candidatus Aveggerthella excrementigallinarum]|nr:pyruvate kinase [Candidatus Aveggerthella excrementigallinarum]
MSKRTKIVCTLGPAVDSEEELRGLIEAGMDVARLNFSHGSHAEHKVRIDRLKKVREEMGSPCAIMLDTCGPEIRTGRLTGGKPVQLKAGETIVLTEDEVEGTAERVHQNCPGLARAVAPGTTILVDDGLIELAVFRVDGGDIHCAVQNEGVLGERKSINVPDVSVDLPALTDQDRADILFGIEQGVDFVAASFVRDADGVREIRKFMTDHGGLDITLISKIESAQAIDHIEDIVELSGGVMVARGDLGVEVPPHRVPHLQKKIIRLCNEKYRPVITATQMLESMIHNPRPTRAEVTDVASAIYDGTDCVMLSGETAMGAHPVEAVRTMARIAEATEPYLREEGTATARTAERSEVASSVGLAAVATAEALGARCIVAPTMSGMTARMMANLRPNMPIYAPTPFEHVMRRMQLYWGVTPILAPVVGELQTVFLRSRDALVERGLLQVGDLAVLTAGDAKTGPEPRLVAETRYVVPANTMCVMKVKPEDV